MKNIMIVDDSPILRASIRTVLERAGYTVCGEAANADETFALYEKEKPGLVLLDILLPGISGLEVLKRLKENNPATKILIVTAVNQDALNTQAKQLGVEGILYKPFEPSELTQAIKSIFSPD